MDYLDFYLKTDFIADGQWCEPCRSFSAVCFSVGTESGAFFGIQTYCFECEDLENAVKSTVRQVERMLQEP